VLLGFWFFIYLNGILLRICGRNSAVECQLPKLDVVGSSPIARSSFSLLLFFLFVSNGFELTTAPNKVWAQVEPDSSRPLGQGQVFLLPGTTDYIGDVPHEIEVGTEKFPVHTVAGWIAEQVGWFNPTSPNQIGLRTQEAGIFFNGIPYPFVSDRLLNWMPFTGTVELLDFPAAAWWGSAASSGAIQLESPPPEENNLKKIYLWDGSGNLWGGGGAFHDPFFDISGNYRGKLSSGLNPSDSFSILSRANWFQSSGLNIETGLLGAQQMFSDNWYSVFTSIKFSSQNFQTIELKPYFQTARLADQIVQEGGSFFGYRFNLAGLAEGYLGSGINQSHYQSNNASTDKTSGFVQTTDLVDVLGSIEADLSFRVDFSSSSNTSFSTLIGLQLNQAPFFWLTDYAKGVLATIDENVQQLDIGIRFQTEETWNITLKYLNQQIADSSQNGGRIQFQLQEGRGFLILKKIKLEIAGEFLENTNGLAVFDSSGKIEFSVFKKNRFWILARRYDNPLIYAELGAEYSFANKLTLFVSVANMESSSVSWPDPDLAPGSIIWGGIAGEF
jgi:hypothetical protein